MLSQAKFFSKWEECGCYDFALFKSCFVVEREMRRRQIAVEALFLSEWRDTCVS